jgi:homotetrameric NADPH-dependent glutamate synthase
MSLAMAEAERCIMCSKPACIEGCPVGIDIPRFIRHLLVRDIDGAQAVINESNLFPSVCGRVCPQESQCEAQCVVGRKLEAVAIGRLERFVGDNARPRKVEPQRFERRLGKVAIVGSGPAGLAVAADLCRYGCEVTVYEALHVVGGVLQYGIPSFRLPREIIAREVDHLKALGVNFETNKVIGKTFSVTQLMGEMGFDAVFVAAGAGAPAFLGIPGEFAGQVYSANEFLTRVNLMGGDKFPYLDTPITLGKSVVVIGAGNTAMDCLRVAKRLGTPTVRCVYRRSEAEAPARLEELRHAKEEGIEFFFLHGPVEILTDAEGNVRGMKVQKMVLGEPDDKGRRQPIPQNEFLELDCDTVIYALGTKANPIVTKSTPGLELNKWGYIVADAATQATSVPGVFAGGDIVTGGATVILAMGAGRRAARAIGAWLAGGKRNWPITQPELDAFVPPVPQGSAAPAAPAAPSASSEIAS